MNGERKPGFYIALAVVVIGLIGFAVYRSDIFAPKADREQNEIDPKELGGGQEAEAADGGSVTTAKEYNFKPAERLPEVKGVSAYRPLENNTVRFAINVWAGWGPIILANNGFKAGKVWKTPDGKDFRLEL